MNKTPLFVAILTLSLGTTTLFAQSGPPTAAKTPAAPAVPSMPAALNQVNGNEINDAQKAAVEKGLEWLAKTQASDGAFGGGGGEFGKHAGITGLAGLAFMEAGNLPGRGKYGDNVKKCLDFVLSACQQSGLISSDQTHGPMYGHGFATLFLSEIYGMCDDDPTTADLVKEKLQAAVKLIERTQNDEGGWRYQPIKLDADISVTICQIMALRAARDSGIKVNDEVITRAISYVKRCQNPDGGFSYVAGQGGGSGFARSAAGVAALYYLGKNDGNDVKKGLDYILRFKPSANAQVNQAGMEGHYFYGNYYAVQAMFLAGGDYWSQWYPAIRDQLVGKQSAGGEWDGDMSPDYGTAIALIILQMPNRYLPVFNGKGPGS